MKLILRDLNPIPPVNADGLDCLGSSSPILVLEPRTRVFPYVVSACLHAVCIGLSILIAGFLPPEPLPLPVYKALIIQFSRPENRPEPTQAVETENAGDRANDLRNRAAEIVMALRNGDAQATQRPATALEQPTHSQAEAILIQPQFPLDLQPPPMSQAVPSMLLWSKQLPSLAPGAAILRDRTPREPPLPDVQEPKAAAVRLNTPNVVVTEAVRPSADPGNGTRIAPPLLEPPPAESNRNGTPAQAITLLSVSNAPPVRDPIVVPPGNLIPSLAPGISAAGETKSNGIEEGGVPGSHASSIGDVSVIARGNLNSSVGPAASTGITASGIESRRLPEPPAPAKKTGITGTGKEPSAPNQNGASATGIASDGPSSAASGKPVVNVDPTGALEHPLNGRFDVVIVQTALDDLVPGISGLLNGKPIYTVYLQVGDTKDWIMHYCARDGAIVQQGAVFQLPDPRPLKAPYPRFTFRPTEAVIGTTPYVFIHGIIDETGLLQNLKVIGEIQSGTSSLLAALGRWRFRPATQSDSPAPVEMVLAIPVWKI